MYGPPEDVKGECNARLGIGDDHGDNTCTMRCQLSPGHEGLHKEVYDGDDVGQVTVQWEHDERKTGQ